MKTFSEILSEELLESVDQHALEELRLYIDNDRDLYRQQFIPIVKNIKNKMKSGKFDAAKAPKLLLYLVDNGAKKYVKEFGGDVKTMFPKPLRVQLAKEMAEDLRTAIEIGEYDNI